MVGVRRNDYYAHTCNFCYTIYDSGIFPWEIIITVIAWDSKEMVSDSLSTVDNKRFSMCQKLFKLKSGAILGTAGESDAREIIVLLDTAETEVDLPSRLSLSMCRAEFCGLLWLPDRTLWSIDIIQDQHQHEIWNASVVQVKGKIAAVGCGADNALGVLTMGGSAVEAVKAAIKLDVFCGGPVQRMTLEAKKPSKKPRPSRKKITVVTEVIEDSSSV